MQQAELKGERIYDFRLRTNRGEREKQREGLANYGLANGGLLISGLRINGWRIKPGNGTVKTMRATIANSAGAFFYIFSFSFSAEGMIGGLRMAD